MTQQNNWQQGVWGDGGQNPQDASGQAQPQGAGAPGPGSQGQGAAPFAGGQAAPQPHVAPSAYQQTYNNQAAGAAGRQQPQPQTAAQPQAAPAPHAAQQNGGWAAPQQPCYQYGYAQAGPAVPPPAPAPKKSRGWIVALVAVILFFGLMFFGVASCNAFMGYATDPLGSLADDGSTVAVTTDSVGIIEIGGTIQYDGTTCSPEGLKSQLDRAEEDPHIVAVVLRVDSGGGVATAGEEMATYVRDFSKPIVVSSASMNASAAYEISSQADYIYTAKTTAVGAIGTALQVTDTSELLDKLGINVENITSADSKDSSYGTRALTDEERAYYQNMVDQINDTFIATVAEGRNMTEDEVRVLATGLTFTGMDAVENGLADEIGTLEDAVAKAASLANRSTSDAVYLQPASSDLSSLLDLMSSSSSSSEAAAVLKEVEKYVGSEG